MVFGDLSVVMTMLWLRLCSCVVLETMTQCQDEVRILSGRTQKLKVAKRCWKQLNEHNLMYIYHKQCENMQKIQWKCSNGQIQCFYKGTSGALCWKPKKQGKQEKLKRELLNFFQYYDPSRVPPCRRACPGLSKYVWHMGVEMICTIVFGPQSRVKCQQKISGLGFVTKN